MDRMPGVRIDEDAEWRAGYEEGFRGGSATTDRTDAWYDGLRTGQRDRDTLDRREPAATVQVSPVRTSLKCPECGWRTRRVVRESAGECRRCFAPMKLADSASVPEHFRLRIESDRTVREFGHLVGDVKVCRVAVGPRGQWDWDRIEFVREISGERLATLARRDGYILVETVSGEIRAMSAFPVAGCPLECKARPWCRFPECLD